MADQQPPQDPSPDEELGEANPQQVAAALLGRIPNYTTSRTLRALDPEQLPNPPTVCMRCKVAMWMLTGSGPMCYCKIQHRLMWTIAEPLQLLACDDQEEHS